MSLFCLPNCLASRLWIDHCPSGALLQGVCCRRSRFGFKGALHFTLKLSARFRATLVVCRAERTPPLLWSCTSQSTPLKFPTP